MRPKPITPDEVVREARALLGTPWHHQGRTPGQRLDCAGVLQVVAKRLGQSDYDMTSYTHQPNPQLLYEVLNAHLLRIQACSARAGDVLVMVWDSVSPRHMAILCGRTIVHALADARQVVETTFDDETRARVRRVYRFPGVI